MLVELKRADLAADPAPWSDPAPNLVTAAALFDLVSAEWIERFTAAVAHRRIAFYTALTHSSVAEWSPAHPADAAMTNAFEHHFGTDKGFGPSAGSCATGLLAQNFARAGYKVERRPSPWRLGPDDRALIAALAEGWAETAGAAKEVSAAAIADWLKARKSDGVCCVVGHEDLLALPG